MYCSKEISWRQIVVEGGRTYIGLPRPLTKAPLMKSPVGTEKAALPGMRRIVETEEVGAMLSRE